MTVPDEAAVGPGRGVPPGAAPAVRGVDAIGVTVLLLVFLIVGVGLLFAALSIGGGARKLTLAVVLAANVISVIAVLAAVQIVLVWRRRMTWRDLGFAPIPSRWMAASAVVGLGCVAGAGLLRGMFFGDAPDPGRALVAPYGFSWAGLIGMLLTAGALMPLVEEIYYRGVLYRWMRSRWRAAVSVPVSAVVFGVTHVHYGPTLMALVALLGVVLALAYERTGSLWPSVIIHATNNSIGVALIYFAAASEQVG